MNWWDRLLRFIACLLLAALAAFIIPILWQVVLAAFHVTPPACNDLTCVLLSIGGVTCSTCQTVVMAYAWFMAIGLLLLLIGIIVGVIRCFLSLLGGQQQQAPRVTLQCARAFGVGQTGAGAVAQVSVTPAGSTVTLQSSDPARVAFAQSSIVGSGSVSLIIGPVPSGAVGDVTLTADSSNAAGQGSDSQFVTVVQLTQVNVYFPSPGGTFTSRAPENQVDVEAINTPDTLADTVTWRVDDDPRDAIDSGDPADPAAGAYVTFVASPPAAPAGRGAPLSYRVRASLVLGGFEQLVTVFATQDERDQCRQEYIDFNKATIPTRAVLVDAATYVNPGNFPFNQINVGDFSVAEFLIANHLQNVRNALAQPMHVNSGYRNPIRNAALPGSAPESRHIYGRAADIRVDDFNGDGVVNGNMIVDPIFGRVGDDWAILANLANNEHATFVEPWIQTAGWVHMEW